MVPCSIYIYPCQPVSSDLTASLVGGYAGSNPKDLLTCLFLSSPGLAKPMGLVEGPGGLGQGGVAATLQDDSQEAEAKFEDFGYNAQLSDRISLDRTIPDYRPKR